MHIAGRNFAHGANQQPYSEQTCYILEDKKWMTPFEKVFLK